MDVDTFLQLQNELAEREKALSLTRDSMKQSMREGRFEDNRNLAGAVARIENEISSLKRRLK